MSEFLPERKALKKYGIKAQTIAEVPSGWSAAARKVHSEDGSYFLKIYDKHKPSTRNWLARIDHYMPVVLWLYTQTNLHTRMTAPLYTIDGAYKTEDDNYLYLLFPFIEGTTIGSRRLTSEQTCALARIVAELHLHGSEIPVPTQPLLETFDISFCLSLSELLHSHNHAGLNETLSPYVTMLNEKIELLQQISELLQNSELKFTLCHTDLHGWNLILEENLILIDWEGLKLAPVEADLFAFTDSFFFDYAWQDFIMAYRSVHNGYQINNDALQFYRLRRRLEDIYEFIDSILFDDCSEDDRKQSLRYLRQECEALLTHNGIA